MQCHVIIRMSMLTIWDLSSFISPHWWCQQHCDWWSNTTICGGVILMIMYVCAIFGCQFRKKRYLFSCSEAVHRVFRICCLVKCLEYLLYFHANWCQNIWKHYVSCLSLSLSLGAWTSCDCCHSRSGIESHCRSLNGICSPEVSVFIQCVYIDWRVGLLALATT
jgi:hypothetical protein